MGWDLAVLWRTKRWRLLLDIIDQLPRHSRYMQAITSDVELAEAMVDQPEAQRAPRRLVSEYTPVVELLSTIADRQAETIQAVAGSRGARNLRKITPQPRPKTAMDRARLNRRWAKHHSLVARVLPTEAPEPVAGPPL